MVSVYYSPVDFFAKYMDKEKLELGALPFDPSSMSGCFFAVVERYDFDCACYLSRDHDMSFDSETSILTVQGASFSKDALEFEVRYLCDENRSFGTSANEHMDTLVDEYGVRQMKLDGD